MLVERGGEEKEVWGWRRGKKKERVIVYTSKERRMLGVCASGRMLCIANDMPDARAPVPSCELYVHCRPSNRPTQTLSES
ncbi:hypothetical protein HZH68_010319 [Vespula germanica]|uniref:Uncharacterized protein n=2 Tax=Vespula TaxID=7451 RepID=A0A834N2L7_VESGE|nr:hypothetical protein HZH68_010319 [Vespula germanica]